MDGTTAVVDEMTRHCSLILGSAFSARVSLDHRRVEAIFLIMRSGGAGGEIAVALALVMA
jgi:hypothetical protein